MSAVVVIGGGPAGSTTAALVAAAGDRVLLLERDADFVRAFTGKLLGYALGRGLDHYDQPAIRRIVREAEPNRYTWSSLVAGIIQSAPFRLGMVAEEEHP